MRKTSPLLLACLLGLASAILWIRSTAEETSPAAATRKIVFIAGKPSHGRGQHEHRAGSMLLADHLEKSGLGFETVVVENGWPADESVFNGASAVVIYSDGGPKHPALLRLEKLRALAEAGVGIGCIHYAVEIPKGEPGDTFLDAIGGFFETHWSVNPHWDASFKMPSHPIANGVADFNINDEWYYHMRFRKDMEGVTPILSALPPSETLKRKDGPHSGNPDVRKAVLEDRQPQHVMWAFQRPDPNGGGRGFGFTGGHFHKNWQSDSQRRVVLNAIAWIAGMEVPEKGIPTATPTDAEMEANQD
ncbi:ThuA domain-containing protein [Akkermansiaceae bacterium]|nr:ThuA domain-containing protein [Akkermansiaceae bacterium]